MTPTDLEPNPPGWLVTVVANLNTEQNREYQDAVAAYKQAIAGWITANLINRAEKLPFTVPPMKPILHVIYPSTAGLGATGQYDMPVDATLPDAVLPPAAAQGNPAPFEPITGTGSNSAGSDPLLIETHDLAVQTRDLVLEMAKMMGLAK